MTKSRPAPLLLAAVLVAVEGLVLVLYGALEAASVTSGRVLLGVTTTVFFVAYGAGLLACAWALRGLGSWARGPVVFAQLVQLGIAWNLRGGSTATLSGGLALVALVVLAGVLLPSSTRALGRDSEPA
jgi:peptidoglycan/LPS O-acetylase OafA/YrhL